MPFTPTQFIGIAFTHVIPSIIVYWWATKVNKNPWKWALIGFFTSYLGLVIFGLRLLRKGLPSFVEYRRANPGNVTANGVSCNRCGSRSIRMWRHQPLMHVYQYHRCNHCGTTLYQSR
ncbi:hypothetical protein [Cupriavidus plantarum]|uniref:hypothetical protein n=1 Tax=Cupriavidus plantarum TaxID=942865 RepID=UPI00339D5307